MNRTFLKGLGLEQEAIDSIMAEYGKDVEGLKNQVDRLTKERDAASKELEAYDGVDIENLKNASENLKQEYEGKIKNLKISGAIEKALTGAKAKHTDLLIDKFDREKIKIDKDGNITGINEQLNGFKETYKDLFTSEVIGDEPNNPDNSKGKDYNALIERADNMSANDIAQILINKGE
ncbi:phage scaffolding protein [Helcococcus kunzii]|uniref:phage scaffolding protein n=1 Tax=Helcococcus kunzii TaxID=40091 RepID=UPI0038A7EDE5